MQNVLLDNAALNQSAAKYSRPSAKSMKKRRVLLCLSGIAIGIVNGLFGAGGGMLTVPVLTYIAGLDARRSHATAIAIILPLCAISSVVYALNATFDAAVVLPTVIGVAIGGLIGAQLLKKLSNGALSFLFYGLMLFAGFKMMFDK